jgi:pantetheine-phosphate adenylyltransferase
MSRAVYPGTFDPITFGHLDLIERGSTLFDELIVAVAVNPDKAPLFSMEERVEVIRELITPFPNVRVDHFEGLVVEYVRRQGYQVILRGLRTVSDFEYEFQMALTNRTFAPDVETVFVMPNQRYSFISSRLIKGALLAGGNVSKFVPPQVEEMLRRKLARES